MSKSLTPLLAAWLLAACTGVALAQEPATNPPAAKPVAAEFDQTLYKGLLGNVLEAVPMDPLQRVHLQRTSAVVSNTLSARSLATFAEMTNPVLLIGGLIWGLWSASNIRPIVAAAAESSVAETPALIVTAHADEDIAELAHVRIVRIWVP
jgi:hypothetical protein